MNLYDFTDALFVVSFSVILWPIAIGLHRWSHLNRLSHILILLLTTLLLLEIYSSILLLLHIRNHYVHYFNTIAVLWFGALFYRNKQAKNQWPILIATVVTCLVPVEVFGIVGFNHINTITESIARLLLVFYSFSQLKQLISQTIGGSLRQQPIIYYHLGFFIYGFFSFITSMFKNYFIETAVDLYYFFDTLSVLLSAVAFCLFAIGLQLNSVRSTTQSYV